jgi:hypothetical protein
MKNGNIRAGIHESMGGAGPLTVYGIPEKL